MKESRAVVFRLLGAVEANVGGRALDLGAARQRSVLAALLVDVNQVIPTRQLISRVWGTHAPDRLRGTLYSYLSRLRGALAAAGRTEITRLSGGYVLSADPEVVDLHRFRRFVAQAGEAHDDRSAAVLYERALRLWRTEAFADLDSPWVNQTRDTLEAERRATELCHNEVKLRLGRHSELLAGLSIGTAAYPLDEHLAGQLMLALYRTGRQADALAHYNRVRRSLADELGADPGAPLQALHHQILTRDAALAAPDREPVAGQGMPRPPTTTRAPVRVCQPTGRDNKLSLLDMFMFKGRQQV